MPIKPNPKSILKCSNDSAPSGCIFNNPAKSPQHLNNESKNAGGQEESIMEAIGSFFNRIAQNF